MDIKPVIEVLDVFDPIVLDEMDKVGFMNRVDTKFVFSASRIQDLLTGLNRYYKVLEINNMRAFTYNTTYLDTLDYLFFNQHVTGKLERNKVRFRNYEATGITYLEVKRRTNKNRTVKWRIKNSMSEGEACNEKAAAFLQKHVSLSSLLLKPVTINRFTRITLVGLDLRERVTLDLNLSFYDPGGSYADIPYIAIAELKRESGSYNSPLANVLKTLSVRPTGFSKYCVGTSILYDLPRSNKIKPKLLLINKIENEYTKHVCA